MSKLIQVNKNDSSIRYISLGDVRLVSYDNNGVFVISVHSHSGSHGVQLQQATFVNSPSELFQSFQELNGYLCVCIRHVQTGVDLSIERVDVYKAVCELFSLPVLDEAIQAFESEV